MRIAFITSEYPIRTPDAGGLATYVQRMSRLLQSFGHTPEIFVASPQDTAELSDQGIRVHCVNWTQTYPALAMLHSRSKSIIYSPAWRSAVPWLLQARALAAALERRHAQEPFQLVQSADFQGVGVFVPRRSGRKNVVRCSSSADLYNSSDGLKSRTQFIRSYLERHGMRRADVVYAPSRFLADHFRHKDRIEVRVIRPPNYVERVPEGDPGIPLPDRFLLHFGQLRGRKGTELLARALPLAWVAAPGLTMLWSGPYGDPEKWTRWRELWGARADQIHNTGPLPRAQLYAVLQRAEAAVLPSQVDNLPNTVIESLMFGIPILGSRGASIDELVEEDVTGHLVDLDDVQGLADALVRFWTRRTPVQKGFEWASAVTEEMTPEQAVSNLIALGHTE